MSKDLITIAIPIFNETGPAEKLVDATHKLPINKEIIIIDDGSTLPETKRILARLKKKYKDIYYLENEKNIGKALSIQKAIKAAQGNIFVILDSDYELDPDDIIILYRALLTTGASLVNGYRVVKDHQDTKTVTNIFSRFSRWVLTVATQILYGFSIRDVLSGYKMFYTKMFKTYSFSSKRFGLETEFIVETIRQGKKIVETNVRYYPRTYKEGKKINLLDSIEILLVLFQKSAFQSRFRPLIIPLLLFSLTFAVYMHTIKYYPTTDALPNTLVALNLIQEQRFDMETFMPYLNKKGLAGITVMNENRISFPKTSIIAGLLSAPVLFVINGLLGISYIPPDQAVNSEYIYVAGKFIGAFYTALSVALMFLVLKRLYIHRAIALIFSLVYAFATQAYSTAAQANWQHGMSLFLLMLVLYIQTSRSKRLLTHGVLGLLLGIATGLRMTNAFYLFIPIIHNLLLPNSKRGKLYQFISLNTGFAISMTLYFMLSNYLQIPSGYLNEFAFSLDVVTPALFIQNILAALFSYNFGLLYGFPILLLGCMSLYISAKEKHPLALAMIPTIILFMSFVGFWWMWTGGYSAHARLLTEMTPLLIILAALTAHRYISSKIYQILFVSFFLLSISTNLIYVYMADSTWHDKYAKQGHKEQLHNSWYDAPTFLNYHLHNQTISISHLSKTDAMILSKDAVYRPSIQYKGIVTLFDGQHTILSLQ